MPEIITGRAHSGREYLFFERVREAAETCGSGKVLVIVPDQFSFEMDRLLYEQLGVKLFNSINTAGVTSLCEKICRESGGSSKSNADDNAKLIAMYRAQAHLRADSKSGITFYRRSLLRPSFIESSLSLVSGFTHSSVSPESLRAAAESTGEVSARLSDIGIIFSEYKNELNKMGLSDSLSKTALAAELSRKSGYFKGKRIFLSEFTSFSADEMLLVKAMIADAAKVTFSLMLDDVHDSIDPFSETVRTYSRIERASQEVNHSVRRTRTNEVLQSEPLTAVNNNCYSYRPEKTDSQGLVKVCAATDVYEESDYICAEIMRLAREENYSLNDIAVICGALDDSSRILSAACERCGIPYFIDTSRSALTSIPAKYLVSILEAAMTRTYKTEYILRIVKSPLADFFYYDACDLEDFCIKWNVEGDMWTRPFVVEGAAAQSARIEESRKKIIEPLEKFRTACKAEDVTVGAMCEALFTLLDDVKMSEKVYSQVKRASVGNDTDVEIMRSLKQVWLAMVGAIRCIYENMREEKMSLRAFSELLTLMISAQKISAPPQKAECLRIGDADRTRLSGVRALFIMQANDGIFPGNIKHCEILSESDIARLDKLGMDIELSPRIQLDSERMKVYSAVTAPIERLYVSYSESDRSGNVAAPSQLPATIRSLFSDDIFVKISELPDEFFCTSYDTAFYKFLEHSKDRTVSAANILSSLHSSAEYTMRLSDIELAAKPQTDKLTAQMAKQMFFKNDLNISATRISDYYKCPFLYFCRYGLKLSVPSTVEIDSLYTGNIAHKCLEYVMSTDEKGRRVYNKKFPQMTDEELFSIINKCTEDYITEYMGGTYGKTLSFRHAVERLKVSILHMAINFREEMKNSLFVPAEFEYDISDKSGKPILSLAADGVNINLRGVIDRVDLYRTDSCTWLRIVDYKTGRQTFDEAEVYHGLDLQMLIYLLAATIGLKEDSGGQEIQPAGIMYSHISFVKPSLDEEKVRQLENEGELENALILERAKAYKPDGMSLGEEILDGMNTDHNGVFTIFRLTSKGAVHGSSAAKPVEKEKLIAMEQFAMKKVVQMAQGLKAGNIEASPLQTKSGLACAYCGYRSMCRNADPKNPRAVSNEDKEKLEIELSEISKHLLDKGV